MQLFRADSQDTSLKAQRPLVTFLCWEPVTNCPHSQHPVASVAGEGHLHVLHYVKERLRGHKQENLCFSKVIGNR